jgi:hypothetical protein
MITENEIDIDIIDFNFTILNEKLLEKSKLNTKIDIIRDENKKNFIKVDSTKFFTDILLEEADRDLGCLLELKYTNKHGQEQNLCHVLKFQVYIKFIQPIYLSINELKDIRYLLF